jgi:hypothetical protein
MSALSADDKSVQHHLQNQEDLLKVYTTRFHSELFYTEHNIENNKAVMDALAQS